MIIRKDKQALSWCIGLLILLTGCSSETGKKGYDQLDFRTRTRIKQYQVQGKRLYALHCANCHGENGMGLRGLIPPLTHTDYITEDVGRSVCLIRYGMQGPVVVNDTVYNQPMPANPELRDLEIAEILTYVLNTWSDSVFLISTREVHNYLNACPTDSLQPNP